MTADTAEQPPDDVPAADWAEQAVDADPITEEGGEPGLLIADPELGTVEADEADVAEQDTLAYGEDDQAQ